MTGQAANEFGLLHLYFQITCGVIEVTCLYCKTAILACIINVPGMGNIEQRAASSASLSNIEAVFQHVTRLIRRHC